MDEMSEAGLGVDYIPTEPGDLEEERETMRGFVTLLGYALGVVSLIAVGVMAL